MDSVGERWARRLEELLEGAASVQYLRQVASTNTRLKELAAAGQLAGPTVLITDYQYAGRGTRTRTWLQPQPDDNAIRPRDLALTFAMPLEGAPEPALSLAVGALVADSVAHSVRVPVYLKWPNDLLAGEPPRKVGGMLLESASGWLLVGVGLNVNSAPEQYPEDLRDTLTTLSHVRRRQLDVGLLQLAVASALAKQLPGADLETLTARWHELDRTAGTEYTLLREGQQLAVTARNVGSGGELTLVDAAGGEHTVSSYTELKRA